MAWLPSFVKLFLVFVAGFGLVGSGIAIEMMPSQTYSISSTGMSLRLLGLLLMLVSPILIALKFFAQLDRKAK